MKVNKQLLDHQIRECVKRISDDDLKYLGIRLSQRIGGDLSESLVLIQDYYPELNKIFTSAINSNELYNTIDALDKIVDETLSRKMLK